MLKIRDIEFKRDSKDQFEKTGLLAITYYILDDTYKCANPIYWEGELDGNDAKRTGEIKIFWHPAIRIIDDKKRFLIEDEIMEKFLQFFDEIMEDHKKDNCHCSSKTYR